MRNVLMLAIVVGSGWALAGCIEMATEQEIDQMCSHLVALGAEGEQKPLEEQIASIEKDYAARIAAATARKDEAVKAVEAELQAKLAEAKKDADKKKLTEEYATKKADTENAMQPDIDRLGQDKEQAIKAAREKAEAEKIENDKQKEQCKADALKEGVYKDVALCRIKADSKDAYWNRCR